MIINRLLNKPLNFQYAFFVFLFLGIITNNITFYDQINLYILYIFSVVCLGIGFYNRSPLFLFSLTFIVVSFRHFLMSDELNLNASFGGFFIHLITYSLIAFISAGLTRYVQKVKEDTLELTKSLANALDSRDPYTMHHSENVAKYSVEIAKKMGFSNDHCEIIHIGSLLHDIGKIGIPEHVLMKTERLTGEEYETIKAHPTIGYNMIKHISAFGSNGVLDIVLFHHERYDGKGYPHGLKGENIPYFARIVAVADAFDAMNSKRVYREKLDLTYTLKEIERNKGTQFDPKIVDAFLSLFEEKQKGNG